MRWSWSLPFSSRRQAAGLTGDIRPLATGQTAQLIDATWPEPRPVLISADTNTALAGVIWTLRWGIERGVFSEETVNAFNYSRVVYARYVNLSCIASQPGGAVVNARAVALEANISLDALSALILPGTPSVLIGPPLRTVNSSVPVVAFPAVALVASADATRRGLVINNFSPAARNLLIGIGAPSLLSIGDRHYFLPPNSTLNIPGPDYDGLVFASWDGADAGGFANVAEIFT